MMMMMTLTLVTQMMELPLLLTSLNFTDLAPREIEAIRTPQNIGKYKAKQVGTQPLQKLPSDLKEWLANFSDVGV